MRSLLGPARSRLGALLLAAALLAPLLLPAPARASRIEGAPVLLADLDTGAVLFERNGADPWFPASLTKLMTAYVALEAVREGRLSMSSLLVVSAEAAAMSPSKMGFQAGSQITLENALKIIMVKSANDVAVTIAEGVGGSTERFVAMMNDAARRLGMRDSRFANPSGLPDPRKSTSARDMALLAQALWRDFPEARPFYGIQAISYGRTVMNNHNGIIGRYPGATGMKTGYICSSGFNVVATAERDGRRLVAVVMGQMTARERTALTASLLEYGFASRGLFGIGFGRTTLLDMPRSARPGPPDLRPIVCDPNRRRRGGEDDNDVGAVRAAGDADAALAYVSVGGTQLPLVDLPERRQVQPIAVHLGPAPGSAVATAPPPAPAAAAPPREVASAALGAGLPLNLLPLPPPRGSPLIIPPSAEPLAAAPAPAGLLPTPLPPPRPASL